jgi:hypothetical protein
MFDMAEKAKLASNALKPLYMRPVKYTFTSQN